MKTGNKFKHFRFIQAFIHSSTALWNNTEKNGCMIFFFLLFARILKRNLIFEEVEIANSPRQYYEKIAIEINHSPGVYVRFKRTPDEIEQLSRIEPPLQRSRQRAPPVLFIAFQLPFHVLIQLIKTSKQSTVRMIYCHL